MLKYKFIAKRIRKQSTLIKITHDTVLNRFKPDIPQQDKQHFHFNSIKKFQSSIFLYSTHFHRYSCNASSKYCLLFSIKVFNFSFTLS